MQNTRQSFRGRRLRAERANPAWSRRLLASWTRKAGVCRCRTPPALHEVRNSNGREYHFVDRAGPSRQDGGGWRLLWSGPRFTAICTAPHARRSRSRSRAAVTTWCLKSTGKARIQLKALIPSRGADLHPAAELGKNCAQPSEPAARRRRRRDDRLTQRLVNARLEEVAQARQFDFVIINFICSRRLLFDLEDHRSRAAPEVFGVERRNQPARSLQRLEPRSER